MSMTEQGKDTPLVNTLEEMAKAPTAFERALDDWSRRAPGSELASLAMHRMVIALAQELADERAIVRGQAEAIAYVGKQATELYRYAVRLEDRIRTLERVGPIHAIASAEAATAEQPTMRTRIQHSHTLKEGWRCSETTVEWSGPANRTSPRSATPWSCRRTWGSWRRRPAMRLRPWMRRPGCEGQDRLPGLPRNVLLQMRGRGARIRCHYAGVAVGGCGSGHLHRSRAGVGIRLL
jgi:hypothetical protein